MSKAIKPDKPVNPLRVAFGLAIEHLRASLTDGRVKIVSNLVGVSPAYYRHVESGFVNLSPARSFDLVSALESKIHVTAVMTILSTLPAIDEKFTNLKSVADLEDFCSKLENFEEMGLNTPKFSMLFKKLLDTIDKDSIFTYKKYREKLVSTGFLADMKLFLTDYNTYGIQSRIEAKESKLMFKIQTTSAIYVELVLDLINSLEKLPVTLAGKDIYKWEDKNSKSIKKLTVLTEYGSILTGSVSKEYQYTYFLNQEFEANIICMNLERNEKNKLIKKLFNKVEYFNKQKNNIEAVSNSITFHEVKDKKKGEAILKQFEKYAHGLDKDENINTVYVFELENSMRVGFAVHVPLNNTTKAEGYSLTLRESNEIQDELMKLYPSKPSST